MNDTLVLRALAALLVVNSHLEHYYPIPQLAADGLLGDSLFFFLSGYGLALSARKSKRRFLDWYGRRLGRIYPSLFLVVFLVDFLPNSGWSTWSLRDAVLNFGWGRAYGFVGQILTFYILAFPVLKSEDRRTIPALLFLLLAPLPLFPALGRSDALWHAYHWTYYFQVMLFGAWVARHPAPSTPGGLRELAGLAALAPVYLAVRVGVVSGRLGDWCFLPHLVVFPMLFLLLRLCQSRRVVDGPLKNRWVARTVGIVGGATLEVYLVHYQVIPRPEVASLAFPLNVVACLAASLALAWLVSVLAARLGAFLSRQPFDLGPQPGRFADTAVKN